MLVPIKRIKNMQLKDKHRLKILDFIRQRYINQKSCKICRNKYFTGHEVKVSSEEQDFKDLRKHVNVPDQIIEQCLNEFFCLRYLSWGGYLGNIRLTETGETFYQKLQERSENRKRDIRSAVVALITTIIASPLMAWLIDWLKKIN